MFQISNLIVKVIGSEIGDINFSEIGTGNWNLRKLALWSRKLAPEIGTNGNWHFFLRNWRHSPEIGIFFRKLETDGNWRRKLEREIGTKNFDGNWN